MQLKFKNLNQEFSQSTTVNEIIMKINEWLGSSYLFSHLNADGVEVYEDQDQYLSSNLLSIQVLEVIAYTPQEFIATSLLDAENYLEGALKEFENLADGFYNTPGNAEWADFSKMLEGMQWLNLVISSIGNLKEKPGNWTEFTTVSDKLQSELKNLEEAIEKDDSILIADLIQYELLPLYESLEKEVKQTIDNEGMRKNVN
ncbi:hypothetical protein [Planomicrobium sp. MB-3u-38]|uniref:hypothetical protein n=1 Tax=Planomicrobium sp. MB-3u-38 TaxID=2058318 RepID=UPI000C7DDE57|nr:hypothetical protein [Planomicrobium sp. MB-3u-38]PKH10357.1 hypothetical protein CXF70_09220 [Planomicrobium sp. MB-3u-38]